MKSVWGSNQNTVYLRVVNEILGIGKSMGYPVFIRDSLKASLVCIGQGQ